MKCQRDNCDGTIDEGYCDVCGLAPAANPATNPATDAAAAHAGATPAAGVEAAGSVSAALSSTAGRSTRSGSTRVTGSGRSARGNLGAGLIQVPPVEYRDPASVIMTDPEVPENRRHCGHCEQPVGRGRDGRPGRTDGFCPHCGARFSFSPKLGPGDLVGGQYEVIGCLAHGGLGWVYLARDRNVSDRWVVLKGLLDEGDESAMAAAIAERRFLAQVVHPNIVSIYNFVDHDGSGYIVMEYLGGKSLKDLRRGPDGAPQPIPVAHAIAYMLEALPALGYLHAQNLLYCDFKPDNVIQTEEQVKLIDLGGVRHMDDDVSDLYGTPGYQAPEVPRVGPSVASDLYTVARTLAVLIFDFRGFQDSKRYAASLPPAAAVPLFRRYPALHRFLARSTHADPYRRFESAGEMAEQLLGVMRQVVAIDGGRPDPAPSRRFTPELGIDPDRPSWRFLPIPAVDPADPAAGVLAGLAAATPRQLLASLDGLPPSPDLSFQRARAHFELGQAAEAAAVIAEQAAADPDDWRSWWWQALAGLVAEQPKDAFEDFERVAAELPGELAPLLGMAMAAELADDPDAARGLYDLVSATDPSSGNACFGLARTAVKAGDRAGAANALRRVPSTSNAHDAAQARLCGLLTGSDGGVAPTLDELTAASALLARMEGDERRRALLTKDLYVAALQLTLESGPTPGGEVAGIPMEEPDLRRALEETCRELAQLSPTEAERWRLVDEANTYRPRTFL